ncbi:glycyl radical protein [Clostridium magnum]|uniref:4-hydroxyphenylacetate decarboxylase large subunit n=1 Tax=Clostridium magnum DSM 2767 TaxID=1121326 RepID=A0A161X9W5_9CLOT|nr:glycyl radical protein [Clostridium magnum]KZL91026.1 4-hydroxyphenylacetate decarboxylase large subunit [Clostridium magnum DSM 2767]SHI64956.1 glycerol dehydratase, cobalamin-independent, large subunit [Clostridium magnum DSM 2767]
MNEVLNKLYSVNQSKRIEKLINDLYSVTPEIEAQRAVLITESFKETEAYPMVIRRAKALEKILNEMDIVIRDEELIVGNLTKKPRAASVFPEFSNKWLLDEFDTLAKRTGDVFLISEDVKLQLREVFKYWDGKTTNELATEYMFEETKEAMAAGVFTVGNYYFNGVGHISVDYAKVLSKGFNGIIEEAENERAKSDKGDPNYIKKEQFLTAVIITSKAVIKFAKRFAELARNLASQTLDSRRREELIQIAENCEWVPAKPARTFYEALQSFWFVQAIIQIESNGHSISPMRFDQYIYPYFKKDISNGFVTQEKAQELLDCLWVKFNDVNKVRDEGSTKAFGGYPMFQNLIIGGQTTDGKDATNELSFMCLEATAHTKLPQPSISIRGWNKTPDELLLKAGEVTRLGLGMPAYYNDEVIIASLTSRGLTLEDARDYGIIGCVEPQKGGKTEGWHDAAFFNMAKVLEVAINNGMDNGKQLGLRTGDFTSFTSFERFMDAYKMQMEYFVKLLINADNSVDLAHGERAPLPFLSSMVDDCIGRGKSLQEGGAHYNFTGPQGVGVANVADSLVAIKKLVFEENKVTLQDLKDALDTNFGECKKNPISEIANSINGASGIEGLTRETIMQAIEKLIFEEKKISLEDLKEPGKDINLGSYGHKENLRQMLLNRAPKFGNDIDEVDDLAREAALIYCSEVEKYTNPRNGQFQPGLYPVSANVPMGSQTGATPDGRKAGEALADGVSPVSGRDITGPTAAVNSVAKIDHYKASNGTLFNQKFHPSALEGQTGLQNLSSLVRSFFDQKGLHVQFNVVSRETLLDAQKNPENYGNLVVRVAGYSAHFTSLDKSIQDDIIKRTEHAF